MNSSWLKPPKLIYLIVGLPLLAGLLGYIGQAIGFWTFPG